MNYENAFKCHDCPESNTKKGCPGWWELWTTNLADGKEEIKKMCYLQGLPVYLMEILKAANRPAAAIESMRNEHVKAMSNLQESLVASVIMSLCNKTLPILTQIKSHEIKEITQDERDL